VSWAAPVEALHLVSGAGQRFSTWNHSFSSQIVARASRSSTDPDQIARIAEGIREGPNALQPAAEKGSADAYLAGPYVTDTMGETR
jgi:hypothetical protein